MSRIPNAYARPNTRSLCATMATVVEIKNIIDDALNPIKSDIGKLLKLEERFNAQDQAIRSLEARIEHLESLESRIDEFESLQNSVAALESELAVVEKLDRRIEEVEQYGRRVCLRFDNIQVSANRDKEDCVEIIINILNETKCGVGKASIDRAHRIGPTKTKDGITTQQIIVRFKSFTERTKVYRCRKEITSDVKIRLDLTKSRLSTLIAANDFAKVSDDIEFAFADINCRLAAKLSNEKIVFFDSMCTLKDKIAKMQNVPDENI